MELVALLAIGAFVFAAAAVQHLYTVRSKGVRFVMTERSQPLPDDGFAGRSARALRNTVESAAMYGPAVVVLVLVAGQTFLTSVAASVYIVARAGFLLAYWAGINGLRSAFWAAGMAAIVVTYIGALAALIP